MFEFVENIPQIPEELLLYDIDQITKNLVALGGIKIEKLNHLKHINCKSIAILSELKKKPANIVNRLF